VDQTIWHLSLILAEIAKVSHKEPGTHIVEEIENGF
jgi:hypothetical protein